MLEDFKVDDISVFNLIVLWENRVLNIVKYGIIYFGDDIWISYEEM